MKPSSLDNENSYTWKDGLYVETLKKFIYPEAMPRGNEVLHHGNCKYWASIQYKDDILPV